MPLLRIETNATLIPGEEVVFFKEATELISDQLDKPKDYIQVILNRGCEASFAGSTEPTAFVELRSLGLPKAKTGNLSLAICGLLQQSLNIDGSRIFINFIDIERNLWGWNGSTFG